MNQPSASNLPAVQAKPEKKRPGYRRCVACGHVAQKEDFLRVVRVYPSQELQLNEGMGRSAYLCPKANCLQVAQKKNRLSRSLKAPVSQDFYEILWNYLSVLDSTSCTPL